MNQQPIGIIGAMKMEVDAILAAMEGKRQEVHGSMAFTAGTLSGVPCVAVQCSPGKVNAALCTQALVDFFSPRLVLNLGVAGGIGEGVHIGDVVIATACVEYDFDTSALDQWPAGQLTLPGQEGPVRFLPCEEGLAKALAAAGRTCTAGRTWGWLPRGTSSWQTPQWGSGCKRSLAPWPARWRAGPLLTPAW